MTPDYYSPRPDFPTFYETLSYIRIGAHETIHRIRAVRMEYQQRAYRIADSARQQQLAACVRIARQSKVRLAEGRAFFYEIFDNCVREHEIFHDGI
jgi:hypothetical protein